MSFSNDASSGESPPTGSPKWLSSSHGRLLYPLFTALIILLGLLLYLHFRRILHKRARLTNVTTPSSSPSSPASNSPTPFKEDSRLSPLALLSLPVFEYGTAHADKLECTVCLSKFKIGEKVRLLPRCGHRFHAPCVDLWFQSHKTCPNCRDLVVLADAEPKAHGANAPV